MNITPEGKIEHRIADLRNEIPAVIRKLERLYDYSYIKRSHGLYHWCKRTERFHFAVPSKEIPDALRAFILLMVV